jgi:hypothetical protein
MKTPGVQELYKYVVKSMTKNELPGGSGSKQSNRTSNKPTHSTQHRTSKKPETGTKKKFPALRFNWGKYFDDIRAFDDKYVALNSVVDKLDRYKKP